MGKDLHVRCNWTGQKRMLERRNNFLEGHVLSLKHRLLAVLGDGHLDCGRRCRFLREQRLATAIDRKGQKRMALLLRHHLLRAAVDCLVGN